MKIQVVGSNIIRRNGKFLLVQENWGRMKGKWNLPAGKLENEDIIACAKREGEEETGFKLKQKHLIGVYQYLIQNKNIIIFVFESEIIGGKLSVPKDEIMDARWFSVDEIKELDKKKLLRGSYILDAIKSKRRISLDFIKTQYLRD